MALLYKRIAFADSPLNLTASNLDDLNANQNSLVLDFDTTAGAIIVNLPSITSLLFGQNSGAGAMTFYINGNIAAGGNLVTINPDTADGDNICGNSNAVINVDIGNNCFKLYIAGRHRWCLMVCNNIS